MWSACNETCGPGQHTRSRECTIPNPGDSLCQGITNQTEECNLVPCPSMYTSYSPANVENNTLSKYGLKNADSSSLSIRPCFRFLKVRAEGSEKRA